ncbi:MXAN_5187 family protein, partial [Corallococcus praedator]|uniref:MXAN_5187 family protein n=1 Tax=Corallococcus praedator TaxID=2316724 RepID=UPI00244B0D2E
RSVACWMACPSSASSAFSSAPRLSAGAKDTVLETGSLQALGPVQLPAFTHGDAMGGQAPLFVGARRALEGTPYEVVALAGTAAALAPLAAYQHTALLALAGLLLLSLVWTALMGGGRSASSDDAVATGNGDTLGWSAAMAAQSAAPVAVAPAAAVPAPLPDPFGSAASAEPVSNPFASAMSSEPVSNPFASAAPPPVSPAADPFGSADAFPFPSSADPFGAPPAQASGGLGDPFAMPPPAAAPIPLSNPYGAPPPVATSAPLADPFAGVESFPFPSPPAAYPPPAAEPFTPPPAYAHGTPMPFEHAAPSNEPIAQAAPRHGGAFAFEDQPTAAYSLQQAANPFALAAAQSPDDANPETTRVAAIPRELLQASTRPTSEAIPMPPPRNSGPQAIPLPGASNTAAAAALSEEQHFQDVFREFVTTRERCGEVADGLTYDKFVQKLRKNKEQLVTKYACKTVRFQVYVKEGKAALKATPVKD